MQSFRMCASAVAVIATIFILGTSIPTPAQDAAFGDLRLAAKGAWDAGTTYAKDDIVTARGSSWISLVNSNLNKVPGQTQPSTAAFWELFARGFNPTGAWSNATKYQPDDLVTRSGQTYRAKLTNTNRPPTNTTFWEVFAARGAAGPNTGIADGTTSAPSISFAGDSNTGIYSPGAGKIAMVEDGALFLHNTGTQNTALGLGALANNSGTGNAALGESALASNTTGGANTALGAFALKLNTSGANNTAVGVDALFSNSTGMANTAVGLSALNSNTGGTFNTAMGASALLANTAGNSNTAIGVSALKTNTVGGANTAVGQNALQNSTGGSNTGVGSSVLGSNTTGSFNTAMGTTALLSNTSGDSNVAIGTNALQSNDTGIRNAALGVGSLLSSTSGNNNIAVGFAAGNAPTAPANSIFIGSLGASSDTNTIKIGTQGTQTTAFMAGITGVTVANSTAVLINTVTGQLGTVASSRRYKEDIETMADVSAVLAKLRPVTFHYKAGHDDGRRELQYGLIAEEVADVLPYLAVVKDGQPETVKYHLLPSFLLAGWQAQQTTIAALTERDRQHTAKIEALEERLRRLEASVPQTRAAALQ